MLVDFMSSQTLNNELNSKNNSLNLKSTYKVFNIHKTKHMQVKKKTILS